MSRKGVPFWVADTALRFCVGDIVEFEVALRGTS